MSCYATKVLREELVLAALSPAQGRRLTPVQVQKLFFLIDETVPEHVGGPHFDFKAYDYGPFDSEVYATIEGLARRGLAEVDRSAQFSMKTYRLAPAGQRLGDELLAGLPGPGREFIERAFEFVTTTPFAELVSAIYKAFPKMRENSVFRD